jgi:hypothetical protein
VPTVAFTESSSEPASAQKAAASALGALLPAGLLEAAELPAAVVPEADGDALALPDADAPGSWSDPPQPLSSTVAAVRPALSRTAGARMPETLAVLPGDRAGPHG